MYKLYHKKRICPVCGTEFQPKNTRGVYCSPLCRWRAFSMRKSGSETLLSNATQTEIQRKEDKESLSESIAKPITEKALQDKRVSDTKAELMHTTNAKQTLYKSASGTNAKQTENKRKENDEAGLGFIIEPFTVKALQDKKVSDPNAEPTESANGKQTQEKRVSDPSIADDIVEYPKSEFIIAISEKVNERGCDERFINPLQYWHAEQAAIISRINIYVRCLLENTLKLSRHRNIPAADLMNIANGYAHVIYSQDFEKSGHPYGEIMKSLHQKLTQVYRRYRNSPKPRLILSREEKVEIIAMLHEIGNTAPLKKFSELFYAINKR